MNKLTLDDVLMVLLYLLVGEVRTQLEAIPSAKAFVEDTLDHTLAEMQGLPPEEFGGAPNAEELAATDARHDANGNALLLLALFYQTWPKASPSAREAAKVIINKYVPNKGYLQASYVTEAARAEQRQPELAIDKEVLDRLPVEGGTAHMVATDYVSAGLELGMLISGRVASKGARADAMPIRIQAIADINHLRSTVARASRRLADRGAARDRYFFGYLDHLIQLRERGSKEPTPKPPPAPADPVLDA